MFCQRALRAALAPVVVLAAVVASQSYLTSHAGAAEFSPQVLALIEQAKKEGSLNVAWSDNAFSGARGAAAFQAGFNAFYGLNSKFNYSPGVAFTAMGTKIQTELAAGKPPSVDILVAGEGQVPIFVHQGVLEPVNWSELIPGVPPEVFDQITTKDGTLVALYSTWRTIVYNTDFVSAKDSPKKLRDFLDPKWKGRTATTSYAAGWGALPDGKDWTRGEVVAFAQKLAPTLGGVMRCGEYDRMTAGEFWIFGLECEPSRVDELVAQGAPLAQHPAADALRISHWGLGVTKHAVNPATAKLFVAFMLSPPGQKLVYQYQGGDLHYLPGSQTAPKIAAMEKEAGEKFSDQTPAILVANEQIETKLQADVAEILRSAR
jgi:ABC-type Fe3+ transport system substrate-binding protein